MRKNFCSAPWSSLYLDPDGSARVCCISDHTTEFENFDSIGQNTKFIEIKNSFIEDEQHSNCKYCWEAEQTNPDQWLSRRSMFQYNDFYHNLHDAKDFKLEYLDARWSNQCNLNCVYCSEDYSSQWSKLLGRKQRITNQIVIEKQHVENVKNILLAGGEPFLMKENIKLLEIMLEVNPDVEIEVTSNLTFDSKNQILKLLEQFKNVTIIASFEATGDRFEYIRKGASWEKFVSNLEYCSNTFSKVQANMVYFSLSLYNLVDTVNVARNYIPANEIYIRQEYNGGDFHRVSKHCLDSIKSKVEQDLQQLPSNLRQQIQELLEHTDSNAITTNLKYLNTFDKLTNSNHKELFPELYYQGE